MNKTKKTLLLASLIALNTKAAIDFSTLKAYAAETTTSNAATKEVDNTTTNVITNENSTADTSNEDIILKINNGTESYTDYKTLKISGVKNDNLEVVRAAVKSAKENKGSNLTKDEITSTVNAAVSKTNTSINNINAGTAVVEDYTNLLITSVNNENISDVNSYLTGKRYKLISKISTLANNIVTAINNINNGTDSENDYATLEIDYGNESNLSIIKKSISETKLQVNKNLNKTEIQTAVDTTLTKINSVFDKVNLGSASLEDYSFIGASNVTASNIVDVNAWLKGKRWNDINNILTEVNSIVKPLANINAGSDTSDDYEALEIEDVTDLNIENVRAVIVEKKNEKGSDLNKSEIMDAVAEAQAIVDLYDYINGDYATVDDYEFAGLENVTEENLNDINEVLKNTNFKTIKEMQSKIDSVIESLNKINDGTDTVTDYNNLFISQITEDNISIQKINIKKAKADNDEALTRAKIIEISDLTLRCVDALNNINSGNGTLNDYNLLGITGVTDSNLSFINDNVKGNDIKTIEDLQSKVDEALDKYNIYNKIDDGTVTIEDFLKLNITIDEKYFEYIKTELKGKHIYSYSELKVEVTVIKRTRVSYEHIISGTATVEDFIIAHYRNVTKETIRYIDEEIRMLRKTSITITDEYIKTYLENITTYISIFQRTVTGDITEADFTLLGLGDIVNSTNIDYVKTKLTGRVIYSKTEFVSIVQRIIKEQSIYTSINLGTATLEDYIYLNVTGVTEDNLDSINDYVKSCNLTTIVDLQSKIDIVVEQLESITHNQVVINRINLGKATVVDYEYIGLTIVTSNNIDFVNSLIINTNLTSIDDIKAKVADIVAQHNYYVLINSGEATLDVFTHLGITGITVENLNYINLNIKGLNLLTVSEIQAKVNALVSIYEYYAVINSGQATLDVYTSLGITGVTSVNINFINQFIKSANCFDLVSLQEKITLLVERYECLVRITSGTATVADYTYIGITNVTDANIVFINANINLKDCTDIDVIKERVNILINQYSSYININAGYAAIIDYTNLGIIGVTPENLPYINAVLKGANLNDVNMIQLKVNEIIDIYAELVRITSGTATVADYEKVKITGVTEANINYINIDIKAKGYMTIAEIKARVERVFSIHSVLGRINIGIATIDDYIEAGAINITAENLDYVNFNIKGNSLDTFDAVKAKVDEIITQYEINLRITTIIANINLGIATVEDYEYININSVTAENIDYINADLKGKNYTDITSISNRVNVLVKIKECMNNINLGIATIADYNYLEISGVYAEILPFVNADLKGKNYLNITDIQNRVNLNTNLYVILNKINLGTASLEDYLAINITNVTAANILYINADLKGQNLLTVEEIQNRINLHMNIYEAIARINAGTATISDFELLNITSVNSSILVYVNADLKGRNFTIVSEIQDTINERLSIYEALLRINLGTAEISHYSLIGITTLNSNLLLYVNADLKGKNYITADEVKVRIEQNLNIYQILRIIYEGKATLDDYDEIGIDKVNDYLLVYVNIRIKGLELKTVPEVKDKVDEIVDNVQTSTVQGAIVDSSNGKAVSGVVVKFKTSDGSYLTKNGVEVTATTDANGKYSIDLPDDEYTAEASKNNYVTENFAVVADSSKESTSQDAVLVPIRTDEKYSVILTWGNAPKDLDSHLKGTTGDGQTFHIYYGSKSYSANGEVVGSLDLDDTTSYGPETTTFTADVDGSYVYSVYDYTNKSSSSSKNLSNSDATVKIYKGSELIKTYTVPKNTTGTLWTVFKIVDGEIIDVNTVANGSI